MTDKNNIEEKLQNLGNVIGSDEKLVGNVMSRIETKPTSNLSKTKSQNIWSNIMKSPVSKLAAAAVIIIVIIVGSSNFQFSSPVYAMTDLPELFGQAKVIHIKGQLHFNLTDKGQKVPPQPSERWIDLENDRFRFSSIAVFAGPEEVKFTITETISDGQYKIILNHADKTAVFYKMSDLQKRLETNASLNHLFFGHLFPDAGILNKFSRTGKEEIDGIVYDIWECEVQESPVRKNLYKYWLSRTGTSGRFQSWYKNIRQPLKFVDDNGEQHVISLDDGSQSPWRLGNDFDRIECGIEIPKDVFMLEVPEGYTAKNTKENAIFQELGARDRPYLTSLRLTPRVSFTLSDGSVILAWHSEDSESTASQNELFENLEFGGALPKLPIEIYGLRPAGWIWTGDVTYLGRHLVYTKRDEKFIEWSLYVPDNPAPNSSQILGYDVLYKYNIENKPEGTMGFTVDYGMNVETKEDFNKWILGAMAELSDDGKAPEGVTYEKVLRLAQQIRESEAN